MTDVTTDCPDCGGKGYQESAESAARCTGCMGDGQVAIAERLEELRAAIRAENISYSELHELQGYGEAGHIPADDVELREWAGLPEFPIHLDSGPRDQRPLCGADGDSLTTDHLLTDCPECIAKHDALTAEPCE